MFAALAVLVPLLSLLWPAGAGEEGFPPLADPAFGGVRGVSRDFLFGQPLAFELVSLILLVAAVGGIALLRRSEIWGGGKGGAMLTPGHVLSLALLLFGLGAAGALLRRDAVTVLMGLELMLNAANLALVTFSRALGDAAGQLLVLLVIAVAAAEAAVGLALIIFLRRGRGSVAIGRASDLRG